MPLRKNQRALHERGTAQSAGEQNTSHASERLAGEPLEKADGKLLAADDKLPVAYVQRQRADEKLLMACEKQDPVYVQRCLVCGIFLGVGGK